MVSSAFFKALQTADGSVKEFKAWLFTVCRNEYFSLCRKKKIDPETTFAFKSTDDTTNVLDKIIRKEEYRSLYRAISLLPNNQKEVILLFYFSALDIHSIAKITEKNYGYVKVLLHRARTNLKSILEVS